MATPMIKARILGLFEHPLVQERMNKPAVSLIAHDATHCATDRCHGLSRPPELTDESGTLDLPDGHHFVQCGNCGFTAVRQPKPDWSRPRTLEERVAALEAASAASS